jgi:hypothetical protein
MAVLKNGNAGIGTATPNNMLHLNGSLAGIGVYNNLSDRRLKINIHPKEGTLNKIMSLRGISFKLDIKANPELNLEAKNHFGFSVQDIEEILPQVVTTASDKIQTKSVALVTWYRFWLRQ